MAWRRDSCIIGLVSGCATRVLTSGQCVRLIPASAWGVWRKSIGARVEDEGIPRPPILQNSASPSQFHTTVKEWAVAAPVAGNNSGRPRCNTARGVEKSRIRRPHQSRISTFFQLQPLLYPMRWSLSLNGSHIKSQNGIGTSTP